MFLSQWDIIVPVKQYHPSRTSQILDEKTEFFVTLNQSSIPSIFVMGISRVKNLAWDIITSLKNHVSFTLSKYVPYLYSGQNILFRSWHPKWAISAHKNRPTFHNLVNIFHSWLFGLSFGPACYKQKVYFSPSTNMSYLYSGQNILFWMFLYWQLRETNTNIFWGWAHTSSF